MLEQLKKLFSFTEAKPESNAQELVICSAAAILLFEVAWADHDISKEEVEHISQALTTLFSLSTEQVSTVIKSAQESHKDSISMHNYTREINDNFTPPEKIDLVTAMWQLALSDQDIHKYEEHIIRNLAERIYVSHSDFIKSKIRARELLG
ncbi:MAG: TerB family tellurite resistance protein [Pseudomonadales bacterium]|nr:TerB family tellurite resistance protein [Pseudomonadales bacterium]